MSLEAPEAAFVVIVGIVLFASVVCNILVVVVVAVTPKLRNPTNVLISNLAISDMLLASIVLPQNLHDISHSDNYFEGGWVASVVVIVVVVFLVILFANVVPRLLRTHSGHLVRFVHCCCCCCVLYTLCCQS